MLKPQRYLDQILSCFGNHPPKSIIVGGSYSTAEECCIKIDGQEYWLSDFDLMCVDPVPYTDQEIGDIYSKMWHLGQILPQENPYFHIGLKIRTPDEVNFEGLSMHYVELCHTGKVIRGPQFKDYLNQPIDFKVSKEILYAKLFAWGVMRLWCNILFFPIRSAIYPHWAEGRLWYSYFVSRGAMDWITWDLIDKDLWSPSYRQRFNAWKKNTDADKGTIELFEKCLQFRLGKNVIDVQEIFLPLMDFAVRQIKIYTTKAQTNSSKSEFDFIRLMLHSIATSMQGMPDFGQLAEAENHLKTLSGGQLKNNNESGWKQWQKLRGAYSDFRFSRSSSDKKDHVVYTTKFLDIGDN